MTLSDRLIEALYKHRKIRSVDITRSTITITWGAIDKMDSNQVKEFPVTKELADLVHIYLSRASSQAEKHSAKEKILMKIL
jgi:predicted DNA-binding WGR domain protein